MDVINEWKKWKYMIIIENNKDTYYYQCENGVITYSKWRGTQYEPIAFFKMKKRQKLD